MANSKRGSWALIVVPNRSFVADVMTELRQLSALVGAYIDLLTSASTFGTHMGSQGKAVRVVAAPNLLDILSRYDVSVSLAGLRMVLLENLELLDPAYELSIALLLHATQHQPTRYIGLSSSLNDPADLGAWLNVDPFAFHSFRPSDRDQSLTLSFSTFTIPQSGALFKAMAKPAHAAIRGAFGEAAIVFVPSRNQCRSVALDLITQCALEMETTKGYLPEAFSSEELEIFLARLQDRSLVDFITRGIAFYHPGIPKQDRTLILELYAEGVVRVLIVPHDVCWSLPVRAATVVVMGTQYLHVSADGEERQLRDYPLEELVRMQGRAVRHNDTGHFHLFCQAEAKDTFTRFLTNGLPLESKLLDTEFLRNWYQELRTKDKIKTKQDMVDLLSFTFLARRLESNPAYYDTTESTLSEKLSRIVDRLDSVG